MLNLQVFDHQCLELELDGFREPCDIIRLHPVSILNFRFRGEPITLVVNERRGKSSVISVQAPKHVRINRVPRKAPQTGEFDGQDEHRHAV